MGFWRIIVIAMAAAFAAGGVYLTGRFCKFRFVDRLGCGKR